MQDFSPLTPHLSIKIVIVRDNTLTVKKGVSFLVTVALIALVFSLASTSDPGPLQDTCVAIDEPSDAGISLVTVNVYYGYIIWVYYVMGFRSS